MVSYIVDVERQCPLGNNSKARLSSLPLFLCLQMLLQNQGCLSKINSNGQEFEKKNIYFLQRVIERVGTLNRHKSGAPWWNDVIWKTEWSENNKKSREDE